MVLIILVVGAILCSPFEGVVQNSNFIFGRVEGNHVHAEKAKMRVIIDYS